MSERSEVSYDGVYAFYVGRINSSRNYGLSGDAILDLVRRCAFWDSTLTLAEFNSIMNLAEKAHIKMMEDNYNDGWKDDQ